MRRRNVFNYDGDVANFLNTFFGLLGLIKALGQTLRIRSCACLTEPTATNTYQLRSELPILILLLILSPNLGIIYKNFILTIPFSEK